MRAIGAAGGEGVDVTGGGAGDVAWRVGEDVGGDLVEESLVKVVLPYPLLRGHVRVVAAVEGQLQHASVHVYVEEVVVLNALEEALTHRRARATTVVLLPHHLAHLLPRARRVGPLVGDGRAARAVLDYLQLPLLAAWLHQGVLPRQVGAVKRLLAFHGLRRQRHRRHALLEGGQRVGRSDAPRRASPDVSVAVGAARGEVAVGERGARPDRGGVGDALKTFSRGGVPKPHGAVLAAGHPLARSEHVHRVDERVARLDHAQALARQLPQAHRAVVGARQEADAAHERESAHDVRVAAEGLDALVARPQLDRPVCRRREHQPAPVLQRQHRPYRRLVPAQGVRAHALVPDARRLVPGCGEEPPGGDARRDARHRILVALQDALGHAAREVPLDHVLVVGSGRDAAAGRGRDGANVVGVAHQRAAAHVRLGGALFSGRLPQTKRRVARAGDERAIGQRRDRADILLMAGERGAETVRFDLHLRLAVRVRR
mmetsp:Transcript_45573/g.126434  ORF Transcript_45573/g.126434 Transcript_45573/m.126434 type:complete len:488 (-) Transcript_45573:39-1502(-)